METGERKLSRSARKAMGAAGRKNLAEWRERAAQAGSEMVAQADAYRTAIFAELGNGPSSTRRALAEAAVLSYTTVLLIHNELLHRSKKDILALTERASWASGQLCRLLKMLSLDARPRPRTLADVFAAKVAPNSPLTTPNPPETNGKSRS